MKIIAFDPGGTTGVAIWNTSDLLAGPSPVSEWKRFSFEHEDHHYELWQCLLTGGPFDAVVYETFTYQRRPLDKGVSLELISCEYIGIIKLAAQRHLYEVNNLVPQSPSQRMFWTDDKLRALGLWVSSPHERDATRHLLYYVTQTLKDNRFLLQLKP